MGTGRLHWREPKARTSTGALHGKIFSSFCYWWIPLELYDEVVGQHDQCCHLKNKTDWEHNILFKAVQSRCQVLPKMHKTFYPSLRKPNILKKECPRQQFP